MNECKISSNSGGGIYADSSSSDGGQLTLNGCQISSNSASSSGGGLYAGGNLDSIAMHGCEVSSNKCIAAGCLGGGVYFHPSSESITATALTASMMNCQFTSNFAGKGGAIALYRSSTANCYGCHFSDNEAYFGGDVYLDAVTSSGTVYFSAFNVMPCPDSGYGGLTQGTPVDVYNREHDGGNDGGLYVSYLCGALLPTPLPVFHPTPMPVFPPTPMPTIHPTSVPIPMPTAGPFPIPTLIPVSSPSTVPFPVPTLMPSLNPTSVPIPAPTSMPTPSPTTVPFPAPTPERVVIFIESSGSVGLSMASSTLVGVAAAAAALFIFGGLRFILNRQRRKDPVRSDQVPDIELETPVSIDDGGADKSIVAAHGIELVSGGSASFAQDGDREEKQDGEAAVSEADLAASLEHAAAALHGHKDKTAEEGTPAEPVVTVSPLSKLAARVIATQNMYLDEEGRMGIVPGRFVRSEGRRRLRSDAMPSRPKSSSPGRLLNAENPYIRTAVAASSAAARSGGRGESSGRPSRMFVQDEEQDEEGAVNMADLAGALEITDAPLQPLRPPPPPSGPPKSPN